MTLSEHRRLPAVLLLVVCVIGCSSSADEETDGASDEQGSLVVNEDVYVEFESHVGNKIVHPSRWTTTDKGDAFSLTSPNEAAIINVLTYTVEGSGTLTDMQDLTTSLVDGTWQDSEWTDLEIGDETAMRSELVPIDPDADSAWRIYVLRKGECYHAILLNASPVVMDLNGDFYEKMIQSFDGISSIK